MRSALGLLAISILVASLHGSPAHAAFEPSASEDIILIRKDCTDLGNNCTTLIDEAADWTNEVRKPGEGSPLVWDVGPGEFEGLVYCDSSLAGARLGYLTIRGRGPGVTTIRGPADTNHHRGESGMAFFGKNCDSLSIQDISFFGDGQWTVQWNRGGSSTWSNVVIVNDSSGTIGNAWYDDCTSGVFFEQGVHFFFGSRLESRGVNEPVPTIGVSPAAVGSLCSQVWLYGSDIFRRVDSMSFASGIFLGKYPNDQEFTGDVRLFGTSVRVSVENVPSDSTPAGITVADGGIVHMHGGIVNVTPAASGTGSFDAVGIRILNEGFVHTPATPFNLAARNGKVLRLQNFGSGKFLSPFLWQARTTPPTQAGETSADPSGDFLSVSGQDMFVETDCNASGNCDQATSGGNEPHLMIYSDAQCGTENPWFDVVTGSCRE